MASLYLQQATVWCVLWSLCVIDTYFLENVIGDAVTLNDIRYRQMINEYDRTELNNMNLNYMSFQHDVSIPHNANEIIHYENKYLIVELFEKTII